MSDPNRLTHQGQLLGTLTEHQQCEALAREFFDPRSRYIERPIEALTELLERARKPLIDKVHDAEGDAAALRGYIGFIAAGDVTQIGLRVLAVQTDADALGLGVASARVLGAALEWQQMRDMLEQAIDPARPGAVVVRSTSEWAELGALTYRLVEAVRAYGATPIGQPLDRDRPLTYPVPEGLEPPLSPDLAAAERVRVDPNPRPWVTTGKDDEA